MKKSLAAITALALCLILLNGCSSSEEATVKTITVSAAASLSPFLDLIATQFEADNKDVKVLINYGSSGTLQKQIEHGAPTDLFISAGQAQINRLAEKILLVDDYTVPILSNSLVVIERQDGDDIKADPFTSLDQIFAVRQPKFIAIGEVNTVPAGIYAKQALAHEAIWDKWNNHYVYGKDVREVLAFVEQGNAELGIVYASDAISSNKVGVTFTIPDSWHEPIYYIGAIVTSSTTQQHAKMFLDYLQEEQWTEVYEKFGFAKVE